MLHFTHYLFTIFGANVLVPIMIFIVALFLKISPQTAMMSAFRAGIGLTGFKWIIMAFTPSVTEIVRKLVQNSHIHLPIVDIGWQAGSLASFSSSVGLCFFILGLLFEIIIFLLKVTRIFMPSNLWNNFGCMIWGTLSYYKTHNFILSLGLSFFMLLVSLVLAEIQADRWSTYYNVDNTTVCAVHNIEDVVPAIILDPLWNLLHLNKIHLTPKTFNKKLGVWGTPTTLGIILGFLLGLLSNIHSLNTLHSWGQILSFAIQLSTVMTIFPLVTDVFAHAFIPLSEEINHKEIKNQSGRLDDNGYTDHYSWFLAVGDGVGYGESATMISGIILIPLVLFMAFILPGNKVLPMIDLIALPYMIESIVAVTNGNIIKVILNSIIWFSLGLYAASWLGPIYTEMILHYGIAIPTGIVLVTSFNLMAHPLSALIFAAFISENPIWIILCVVLYIISLILLRKYRYKIWKYLRIMSEKNIS